MTPEDTGAQPEEKKPEEKPAEEQISQTPDASRYDERSGQQPRPGLRM